MDFTKPAQRPSPLTKPSQRPPTTTHADSTYTASSHDSSPTVDSANNLATMKCFVHEVLRRSRTSGCVLQTAVCYLEAIRARVPVLLQQERSGIRSESAGSRIVLAQDLTEEERISLDTATMNCADTRSGAAVHENEAVVQTVRLSDTLITDDFHSFSESSTLTASSGSFTTATVDPTPTLPSPLLCPRRAFLASLILASKFTQDKCYSNRAWAKLSGLPPREISRCERALGEALDWRLWVGKQTPAIAVGAPTLGTQRSLCRSQSENAIMVTPQPLPHRSEDMVNIVKTVAQTQQNGLRRCATLPAEAYALHAARPLVEAVPPAFRSSFSEEDIQMSGSDVAMPKVSSPTHLSALANFSFSPTDQSNGFCVSMLEPQSIHAELNLLSVFQLRVVVLLRRANH